jgi:hypothetical protein
MRVRSLLTLVLAFGAACAAARAQSPLRVAGLPEGAPLSVTASATERVLLVDLALAPEWHAYARDVGNGLPVRVALAADGDFAATGALVAPCDARGQLGGAVRLSLPIAPVGAGRALRATFDLQVCDALQCLAPMTLTISGEVEPVSVLLVVAETGERAERIAGWLRGRGFDVALDTYAEVTPAACDARDVVLTDSDLSQKHGVATDVVRRFPRTASPVVAVGHLGTKLVEAHGLAMTSGYI